MNAPSTILITGASSGLGAALAREYAAHGIRLFLTGRDGARLAGVAEECKARGAEVRAATFDIREPGRAEAWIASVSGEMDLVIAGAGISAGTGGGEEGPEQARAIFAVNVDGVLSTVLPAAKRMQRQGSGQIAIISSLASYLPLPGAPAYSASKAAVRFYGEALGAWLAPHGVGLTVICPGFIRTPMTDVNPFPMPFLMSASSAARRIRKGLGRPRRILAFPWPMVVAIKLLAALPLRWREKLLARMPQKP